MSYMTTMMTMAKWLILFVVSASVVRCWEPAKAPLMTQWAADVTPDHVWPQHPRPTFYRNESSWVSLNGLWEFDPDIQLDVQPVFNAHLPLEILVPFPVESALSGLMYSPLYRTVLYRKVITIKPPPASSLILLHFEASDWQTDVWVNGQYLGRHTGGYDRFSFDITHYLFSDSQQELIVKVWDPSETGFQPQGKQDSSVIYNPSGITYTSTTGIWQTVWLETVPAQARIVDIFNQADIDAAQLLTQVFASPNSLNATVQVEVVVGGKVIAKQAGAPNSTLAVQIPTAALFLWSPNSPFLYNLTASLIVQGEIVDQIKSYFGMRKIEILRDIRNIPRAYLNHKPFFQVGTLDQGFWPDGAYTAPTDDALRFDLEAHKLMGFNLVRKHAKVESERWYYWTDVLGLVVWQDMPQGNWIHNRPAIDPIRNNFQKELLALVDGPRRNHPSIVQWTVFNEGWGQPRNDNGSWTINMTQLVQAHDKNRLVCDVSGWYDTGSGNNVDMHHYPAPDSLLPDNSTYPGRHAVLGEYGGILLTVESSQWSEGNCHGYQQADNATQLFNIYASWIAKIAELRLEPGLDGSVYTQLSDVETECNGLLTYDRIFKVDPALLRGVNSALLQKVADIASTETVVAVPQDQENPANK